MYYQRPLIFRIIESFFRHWRLFAITIFTIVTLLTAYVALRPKTYNTEFTVVTNAQSVPNPLSTQTQMADWNAINQTVSHFQTLISTKEFIQGALYPQDGSPVKLNHSIDLNDQDALLKLQKSISVFSVGNDAFAVGLTYEDADDSVVILKSLINHFIDMTAQEKSAAYTHQVAFLQDRVNEYRDKLKAAESQLSAFKAENIGHLPSQQAADEQQLANLQQQVQQFQTQLLVDRGQEKALAAELSQTPQKIIASQTAGVSPIDAEIKNLQTQLELFTVIRGMKPNHPQVLNLRSRLNKLLAQRAKSTKGGKLDPSGITSTIYQPNPQYLTLQTQYMQIKTAETGLVAQIADAQKLLAQTEQGVAKIPEEERLQSNLERDYSFNSTNYTILQQKLEEAKLSEQINLRQQRDSYNVYETAMPQPSTSKSKTVILFVGGLFLALIVASGLVILSEAVDRSFRDPYDLQRTLGVPVLAMLPESPDLHVADSKNPLLPGGGSNKKRLGKGKDTPLLPGSNTMPGAAAAGVSSAASAEQDAGSGTAENSSGNYNSPGFGTQPATGAGGAAAV